MTKYIDLPPEGQDFNKKNTLRELTLDKLEDAKTLGYQAEFAPDEAEVAGAFVEDALSEEEALESSTDYQ